MKKTVILITVICLALALSTANAISGPVSTSQASIDWENLDYTGVIEWSTPRSSGSEAFAQDDTSGNFDQQSIPDWGETGAYATTSSQVPTYGEAYTNDIKLYEEVYAFANETITMQAYANADAWRWGYFTAESDGWVTFFADYQLFQDLFTDVAGEEAYGYAEAGLFLGNAESYDEDEDLFIFENEVWDGDSISNSDEGTLTVSVWFDEGDEGYFEVWVYNEAEVTIVPEPATVVLLGLGGLSLIRRKR